ncbi:DUF4232 domain-containing protein [Micromonospora sp. NPDC048909]|uniref:DUF4232 domain-containing protein n=1 Tax=Micromonospora sp. NPDC048909 TaxID=3155643 RepID=UPI0033F3DD81
MRPRPAHLRLLLAGLPLVGAVLLGACMPGSGPASRAAETSPAPTPDAAGRCPESGVLITSTGSDAAMGLRALGLDLTNCGSTPYLLKGYPVLRVLDEQRAAIPLRTVAGAREITTGFDAPPGQLTLNPGERAHATVLWRNTVTDSTVDASDGEYLEVAPAAGQPAQSVDPDGPIDLGNTGRIGVSAWKAAEPTTPAQPPAPTAPSGAPSIAATPDSRL